MADWIWVIGAGIMQVPLIREAQRRGFRVLVSDRNISAPGVAIADGALHLDTYDVRRHLEAAKTLTSRPAAVLTAGADVGPTVSALAERYGLRAASYEAAYTARNKALLRLKLTQPHPVFQIVTVDDPHALSEMWEHEALKWERTAYDHGIQAYPCVVKPSDNSASRGHTLVRQRQDFAEALKHAWSFLKDSDRILIEEFLTGWEAAFDWFVAEDGTLHFANGARRFFHPRYGLEAGHVNPQLPPPSAAALAVLAAEKLKVVGPFKTDFMFTEQYGPILLECATRLSGGFDHMYTGLMATGRDITGALLNWALGQDYLPLLEPRHAGYAAAYSPVLAPGKVARWELTAARSRYPEARIFITSPHEIPEPGHCGQRALFVLERGVTAEEAWQRAQDCAALVQVEYC